MKAALCASLFLMGLLAACGPTTTPAAPATQAPAAPTATTLPPTATTAPATATAVPATPTNVPATATTAPSATSVPPSATPLPATATALPASPTPLAIKLEFAVSIKNFEFMPRDIRVAKGTTVTWTVLQGTHTTTSDDFRTKGPNSWHSGDLSTGQSFSFTFNTPGEYRFFCGFHSEPGAPLTVGNMNGLVTVQ